MAFSFNSVAHWWAKAWTAIKNDEPKVEAGLQKVEGTEGIVETVTAAVPGAAPAVGIEKVAFALLGEFSSLLAAGDAAAKSKLADAGVDVNVIAKVEDLLKTAPQLVTVAKAL